MFQGLKNVVNNDIEDMVFSMKLTSSEVQNKIDTNFIATSFTGYTFLRVIFDIGDFNSMLKSLLPNELKANIALDDIKIKSISPTDKTISFTEKSFFYTLLGFTQSHLGILGDIEGFIQKISE